MKNEMDQPLMTRRGLLRRGAVVAGGALLLPSWMRPLTAWSLQQAPAADAAEAMRAQLGATPIEQLKLADNLSMLSGPGGNVLVLHGTDGKVVVDTFLRPAWPRLKETLDAMGGSPITAAVDTHWHFDHADNNANFRKAGAAVVAHQNTRKRLGETHELLGMRFPPAPPEAMPTRTFQDSHKMDANGEHLALGHIPPAHTDGDIYVRCAKANVIHLGDVFFNGMYPVIDGGSGGSINGMIAGADMSLKMVDGSTRIVPGHGPLAKREDLARYREMLVTARDAVQKLKKAGRTLEETIAAGPTRDLDAAWGKGFLQPKDFVAFVYNTL